MDSLDTMPITDEELASVASRADKATKGPWKSYIEGREQISGASFIMTQFDDIYLSGGTEYDQDFIASAREDIPKLLQEIRRLKAGVA